MCVNEDKPNVAKAPDRVSTYEAVIVVCQNNVTNVKSYQLCVFERKL